MAMDAALSEISQHASREEAERSAMRILVVEDDAFTLAILQKRLSSGGYAVATASNGREGLEKVTAFRPEIILSDWMMPEMDGLELCARVREMPEFQSTYFILLTAKDRNDDKISGLDTGADEYLIKPCEGRELMARLRAAGRIVRLQEHLNERNRELQLAMKRINQELQATSQIQRALLPGALPELPGYEFAAHYQPSTECSGDFYDFFDVPDGRLLVAIGDVSGHGAPAMVAMALAHTLLKIEAGRGNGPAQMLEAINALMFAHLPTVQYVTMFLGLLEAASGRLVYSSAGHNPPLWIDRGGQGVRFLEGCEGFPVKLVSPDAQYADHEIRLEQCQHLLLYTDGIIEAFNEGGEMYGSRRLLERCRSLSGCSSQAALDHVRADLVDHTAGRPLDDDLSMVVISRR
jgi:sigma-B regulation protein RsbU (phosphoserine phosphatase)